jgi:hypothetical protein
LVSSVRTGVVADDIALTANPFTNNASEVDDKVAGGVAISSKVVDGANVSFC